MVGGSISTRSHFFLSLRLAVLTFHFLSENSNDCLYCLMMAFTNCLILSAIETLIKYNGICYLHMRARYIQQLLSSRHCCQQTAITQENINFYYGLLHGVDRELALYILWGLQSPILADAPEHSKTMCELDVMVKCDSWTHTENHQEMLLSGPIDLRAEAQMCTSEEKKCNWHY